MENLSVTELVSLLRRLPERVEALETENASLRERLRAAERLGAPFPKVPGPCTPKKPGRHPGKGRFERREDRVEELRAALDSPDCPQCGARLEVAERVATVEDTPAEPVRIIRRFHVEHGVCAVCGWSRRGPARGPSARPAQSHGAPDRPPGHGAGAHAGLS